MSESLQQALHAAVLRILHPLIAVLLRHGMAYGTFAELARKVYVDKAFEQMKASGKRPSISSVSAVTGLTRKETKRLREMEWGDDAESAQRYNRAIRVISGWTGDSDFLDADGEPRELPLEGDNGSFSDLVRRYSGDIPPKAMLKVLEAGGTASVGDTGVKLLTRAYIPAATPVDKIHILGSDVAELTATIDHNLDANAGDLYFQRKVSNVLVHPDAVEEFRELSNAKSQQLLEDYHRWLSDHEIDPEAEDDVEPCYLAVGIFYTNYRPDPEESA